MAFEPLADFALARRLERAEGAANARFVEARARLSPDSGARWIEVAGAYAMYDGPQSPLTQTFALGLFETPSAADLERLETFFRERQAPVFHEISPIALTQGPLLALLNERRYQPVEFTSVLFQPLGGAPRRTAPGDGGVRVRVAGPQDRGLWARTAAEGWRELTEFAGLMEELLQVSAAAEGVTLFLAECGGEAAAAGALSISGGVALLAGASTIPEWRRRGAQRALLESRLRHAAAAGCGLAMVCAEAGSASQRNAERQGFRIAYTRIKWRLAG